MLRGRLALGRINGIPVGVHWSVLVILVLLAQLLGTLVLPTAVPGRSAAAYWVVAIVTAICLLASLLAHELAHAVVARRYGMRVSRITLWLLGGVAEIPADPPNPRAQLRMALAGPLTSLAVGVVAYGAAYVSSGMIDELFSAALVWIAMTNGIIAVFNMLPGSPLDGGRVLQAVLWRRTGDRELAARRAANVGRVLGALIAGFGLAELLFWSLGGLWFMLIGWFLVSAATVEGSTARTREQLAGLHVADVMAREPEVAPADWPVRMFLQRVAGTSTHRVFPTVDSDGHPVGIISLTDLARLTATQRAATTIGAVARPLSRVTVTTPDASLAEVIVRAVVRPDEDLILVVHGDDLVGVVSAGDIQRAALHGLLGVRDDAGADR